MPVTAWHAELAWLGGERAEPGVLIETEGERITAVTPGVPAPARDAVHLPGLTLPGLANAHSHAFHRVLRGRTQRERGTFWTWREQMYAAAARLTPDSYHALARATYAEMALAGITCVGEFHYLHHDTNGRRYADPNAMGAALIAAARDAGIRITLIDTCYLAGGPGAALEGVQERFGDGDASGWAARASGLADELVDELVDEPAGGQGGGPVGGPAGGHVRIGAAIHSVRAVPPEQLSVVVEWARQRGAPLHFHLSEQTAENDASRAAYGRTPTQLLAEHGALGPLSSAVHATHLDPSDIALLGGSGTVICLCPTTERDLADGIGPARELADAGSPLSLGSDSQAVIDIFAEARAVELDERLRTRARGHWLAGDLLHAATAAGHASLGWGEAGRLQAGALADFLTVTLDSVRLAGTTAGTAAAAAVFAATAADVREVVVGGRRIVSGGRHLLVDDVPTALDRAIRDVVEP